MSKHYAAFRIGIKAETLPHAVRQALAMRDKSEGAWLELADAATAAKADPDGLAKAGFMGWQDFCESPHGLRMSRSHVDNCIRAADGLRLKLSDEEIAGIGVKRALAIAPLIKNGVNSDTLLTAARALPVKEFEAELDRLAGKEAGAGDGMTRIGYKLTEGGAQVVTDAISKAMREADTEDEGRALELICADYLAGA